MFYQDVYAFVDRLKDMEQIKGEKKLQSVVLQCLQGSAPICHSTELSEMEKSLLRQADLDAWYETLITCFKQRTPLAVKNIQQTKYTMGDANEKKYPRQFVQNII